MGNKFQLIPLFHFVFFTSILSPLSFKKIIYLENFAMRRKYQDKYFRLVADSLVLPKGIKISRAASFCNLFIISYSCTTFQAVSSTSNEKLGSVLPLQCTLSYIIFLKFTSVL